MFSYIYADSNSRGLTFYTAAKTEDCINKVALDYIRGMLADHGAPQGSPLLRTAMEAVDAKDINKAMEAWNDFATIELKHTVAKHGIQPIAFVE